MAENERNNVRPAAEDGSAQKLNQIDKSHIARRAQTIDRCWTTCRKHNRNVLRDQLQKSLERE